MCEQGRIQHHLRNSLEDPRNTVRVFCEPVTVRAGISSLDELSGHADQGEPMEWLRPLTPHPKRVFLAHGEPSQSLALAAVIRLQYGVDVVAQSSGESFAMDP
jgi:metallo-beta-lactamase family protein